MLSWLSSRLSHVTMAISEAAAQCANRLDGVPESRIRVAYSGVEEPRRVSTEEVSTLRSQLGIPKDAPVISIVARLRTEKGHHTLLEAMPLVAAGLSKPPHLVIVGNGSEENALKNFAVTVCAGGVHFVGHKEDVAPWFALGDVIAIPSYQEAFGLSAAEAMACSRPLVASRVGGLVEIIEDGNTGILVAPQDARSLANGLLTVLRSPDIAARMASAAFKRFQEHFTVEAMVKAWLQCYDELQQSH